MKSRTYAYLLATIHASIVGLSFLFTKMAIGKASPLDTLAHRFSVSFVVILILVAGGFIKVHYSWNSVKKLIPLSLLFPTLFFAFQTFGLKYTQSTDAGILSAVTPIITVIIAGYFLKERTSLYQKMAILLSVAGVIFIFLMKGNTLDLSNTLGMGFILLSCIATASYTSMTRSIADEYTPGEMSFFMMGTGCVLFNIAAVSSHIQKGNLQEFFLPWSSMSFVISTLYLGVLASLVTSMLSNIILTKIKASQMSVFANLSTVITIAAGAVILNERITLYDLIGSFLIIIGVIATNYFGGRAESQWKLEWQLNKKEESLK